MATLVCLLLFLVSACTGADQTPTPVQLPTQTLPVPTKTPTVKPTDASSATPLSAETRTPTQVTATPLIESWQEAPVIPSLNPAMVPIFELGQSLGNSPRAFSKVGDSETFTTWFLTPFDVEPVTYDLGPYQDLEAVIDAFQGSFARESLAARRGFNASSVFAPLWADPTQCQPGETPLACEFRIHKPSFVFILLGTNDYWHKDDFETQMRKIITTSLEFGVIPILGTKADNLEGDGSINATIFKLAQEFKLPLWNFWRAVQGLPENGLDTDGAHLTFGVNDFDNPEAMRRAWPVRNLTALQVLDAVWRAIPEPVPGS